MAWISRYSACKSVGFDHEHVGRNARIFFAAGIFHLLSFRSEAKLLLALPSKMVLKCTPEWPNMVHFTPFGYPWAPGVAPGIIFIDFGISFGTLLGFFWNPLGTLGALWGPRDSKKWVTWPLLSTKRDPGKPRDIPRASKGCQETPFSKWLSKTLRFYSLLLWISELILQVTQ